MGKTHELLSQRQWLGIPLRQLLQRELGPYAGTSNIDLSGSEVILGAEAGQTLAMVLHELTTNASKYGALSEHDGRIEIDWRVEQRPDKPPRLKLEWRECDGPPVQAPARSGFGSRFIQGSVASELQGVARMEFEPEGLCCTLDIPLEPEKPEPEHS